MFYALLLLGCFPTIHCFVNGFSLKSIPFSPLLSRISSFTSRRSSNELISMDAVEDIKIESNAVGPETEFSSSEKSTISWTKQWYPLMVDSYTDRSRPHPHQLLGNDIVLWHDGQKWNAFEDFCPHRGVPLSEGRVEKNGKLLCAYHAWTYDGSGQCTSIPQTIEDDKQVALLAKTCVKSHPVKVLQGLVWVWGESGLPGSDTHIEAALKQPRVIEELNQDDVKDRIVPYYYGFKDLAYGWDMFMENVMDPAHVPVSHHGIVGSRYKDAKPLLLTRIKSISEIPISEGGQLDPRYPEDAGFAYDVRPAKEIRNPAINDFRPPVLQKITSFLPNDARFILALYATPTKPGFCRHIGTQVLIKGKDNKSPPGLGFYALPLPMWLLHPLAALFLHQDMVFLHHQERVLYHKSQYAFGDFQQVFNLTASPKAYSANYFMPNPHDKMISSLRQWIYNKAGGGPKWGSAALSKGLPQRLPENELFDVYNTHAKNCVICTNSIKNLKNLKNLSAGLAILSAVALKGWRGILTASLFGAFSVFFHKFSKLYFQYSYHHQNNN